MSGDCLSSCITVEPTSDAVFSRPAQHIPHPMSAIKIIAQGCIHSSTSLATNRKGLGTQQDSNW